MLSALGGFDCNFGKREENLVCLGEQIRVPLFGLVRRTDPTFPDFRRVHPIIKLGSSHGFTFMTITSNENLFTCRIE